MRSPCWCEELTEDTMRDTMLRHIECHGKVLLSYGPDGWGADPVWVDVQNPHFDPEDVITIIVESKPKDESHEKLKEYAQNLDSYRLA